jgi:hypothetical protein
VPPAWRSSWSQQPFIISGAGSLQRRPSPPFCWPCLSSSAVGRTKRILMTPQHFFTKGKFPKLSILGNFLAKNTESCGRFLWFFIKSSQLPGYSGAVITFRVMLFAECGMSKGDFLEKIAALHNPRRREENPKRSSWRQVADRVLGIQNAYRRPDYLLHDTSFLSGVAAQFAAFEAGWCRDRSRRLQG